ncbi:MAG: SMC-Scp complex subunit ScpB [Candidatus Omnitrophota bacterium]
MDEQQMNQYLRGAIEAVLLISEKPVEIDQIKEAIETVDPGEIRKIIKDLQEEYDGKGRGMIIREIAGGFQMLSNPQYAEHVRNFFKTRVKEKLSRPGLETLAIIAYRQPVSRADVELIRGVNSDGVVTNLLEKGLIKIVGRKDVPGRPFLYGTTKLFLEYFGLKSLKDLPKLEDVSSEILGINGAEGTPETRTSSLFDSNKAVSMEEAVQSYGEGDHLNRAFKSEQESYFPDDEEDRGDLIAEPAGTETQVAAEAVGAIEEALDLKKAMEDMNKDHPMNEQSESQVE